MTAPCPRPIIARLSSGRSIGVAKAGVPPRTSAMAGKSGHQADPARLGRWWNTPTSLQTRRPCCWLILAHGLQPRRESLNVRRLRYQSLILRSVDMPRYGRGRTWPFSVCRACERSGRPKGQVLLCSARGPAALRPGRAEPPSRSGSRAQADTMSSLAAAGSGAAGPARHPACGTLPSRLRTFGNLDVPPERCAWRSRHRSNGIPLARSVGPRPTLLGWAHGDSIRR